jgi:hypothetical protein
LLGFLADLSLGLLSDKDVEFLAPTVCLLVVCYCPSGFRPPEIDFDELKWAFHTQLSGLDLNAPCLDGGLGKWLESSRQPELLRLFLLAMGKLVDEAPKKLRPGKNAKMGFVIVLRVLVDEFDRLLRTGE